MNISAFSVYGLFGTKTVRIPISNNRLVLVGVNGIGKSTVLNMFYAFVSLRWDRLREYAFDSIELTLNGSPVRLSKEELVRFRRIVRSVGQYPALGTRRAATDDDLHNALEAILRGEDITPAVIAKYNFPLSLVRRLRDEMTHASESPSLFSLDNYFEARRRVKAEINATVVYLPTYRRIEKELSTIVPSLEDSVKSYEERSLRAVHEATFGGGPRQPLSYIDLVQFGMRDVEQIIGYTLTRINFSARERLNELSGDYLREVIRAEVSTSSIDSALKYNEEELRSIMDRVSEGALEPKDKNILIDVVERVRKAQSIDDRSTYLLHYLGKLVEFVRSIETLEDPVRNFIDVCNRNYFIDKRFVYDTKDFSLNIRRTNGGPVELKDLSSGEKQVISLFCHLYLGASRAFIVLIDEPELSLSVDWQVSFLPDIMKTGRCQFLFAVTHSPFVHENEFDEHTVDLTSHMAGG